MSIIIPEDINWLLDGEKAEATVLNRPLRDVLTKLNVELESAAGPQSKLKFDLTNTTAPGVGELAWNQSAGTLDLGQENGVTLQIGQEQQVSVYANTNITNGQVVMAVGTIVNTGKIKVQQHDGTKISGPKVIGIATHDIAIGEIGLVTSFGKVRDIDTTGAAQGETWVDGDVLYIKPNDAGALTNVEPSPGELLMRVATVVNSHATKGALFIRVSGVDEASGVAVTGATGSALLPSGTDAQRDMTPIDGMIRFNSETPGFEGYFNGTWQSVGGGQMLGKAQIKTVSFNSQVIDEDILVTSGLNAYSVGNVTIEAGKSITVEATSSYKVL